MSRTGQPAKLIKTQSKGQITIPAEFRRRLRIDDHTILRLSLKGSKIEILPLRAVPGRSVLREYSGDEIDAFLKEDRLDSKSAEKVRRMLGRTA